MKTYTISWPPQLAMSYLGSGDLEHQNKETLSYGEAALAGKIQFQSYKYLINIQLQVIGFQFCLELSSL